MTRVTNRFFATHDNTFLECCEKVPTSHWVCPVCNSLGQPKSVCTCINPGQTTKRVERLGIPPTVRQASKFRRKKGLAYREYVKLTKGAGHVGSA